MANILIIGCGDIGGALASQLRDDGHQVTGLKRSAPQNKPGFKYFKADITCAAEIQKIKFNFDQIVYILSPSGGEIVAYEEVFNTGIDNLLNALKEQQVDAAITFVSSTRVYGQQQGEWLDETSDTQPTDERGRILLDAERTLLAFSKQTTIVRFSGIYGRSNYFINQLKLGVGVQKNPPYYTNRIHRADCIGALAFIINKKSKGAVTHGVYLGTDDDPASKWDVACYLADALSIDRPTALMLNKQVNCNKRLANNRLKAAGYQFKYKSYKEGYQETIDEGV